MKAKKKKNNSEVIAKPFVKWAGGKGSLLRVLDSQLPIEFATQQNITYIEPFVGGGAFLFYVLSHYKNIQRVIINDVNKDLIRCYQLIKRQPKTLISLLEEIENKYYRCKTINERKEFYYSMRATYNSLELNKNQRAAYFIFLNHTCYNGLYRENSKGKFNVPFGKYKKPIICNKDLIMVDHNVLANVEILCGDYSGVFKYLDHGYNFVYIDPPYRPLLGSDNFKEYSKSAFGDQQQEELKVFCDLLTKQDCHVMVSNSDSRDENDVSFFETLFNDHYYFSRVLAPRYIGANAEQRKKQTEIIIKNYFKIQGQLPLFRQ